MGRRGEKTVHHAETDSAASRFLDGDSPLLSDCEIDRQDSPLKPLRQILPQPGRKSCRAAVRPPSARVPCELPQSRSR